MSFITIAPASSSHPATPWRLHARSMRCSRVRTSAQTSGRPDAFTRWRLSRPSRWLAASPASTARHLPPRHRKTLIGVQVAFALAVAWFAGRTIRRQWTAIEDARLTLDPHWSWIVLAALIVFATYLLLVQVWVIQLR